MGPRAPAHGVSGWIAQGESMAYPAANARSGCGCGGCGGQGLGWWRWRGRRWGGRRGRRGSSTKRGCLPSSTTGSKGAMRSRATISNFPVSKPACKNGKEATSRKNPVAQGGAHRRGEEHEHGHKPDKRPHLAERVPDEIAERISDERSSVRKTQSLYCLDECDGALLN
jgi:hypothetical protein